MTKNTGMPPQSNHCFGQNPITSEFFQKVSTKLYAQGSEKVSTQKNKQLNLIASEKWVCKGKKSARSHDGMSLLDSCRNVQWSEEGATK